VDRVGAARADRGRSRLDTTMGEVVDAIQALAVTVKAVPSPWRTCRRGAIRR